MCAQPESTTKQFAHLPNEVVVIFTSPSQGDNTETGTKKKIYVFGTPKEQHGRVLVLPPTWSMDQVLSKKTDTEKLIACYQVGTQNLDEWMVSDEGDPTLKTRSEKYLPWFKPMVNKDISDMLSRGWS